jgi:hypothetical protein
VARRGKRWEWRAENLPTREFIDTHALFAEIDRL